MFLLRFSSSVEDAVIAQNKLISRLKLFFSKLLFLRDDSFDENLDREFDGVLDGRFDEKTRAKF